MHQKLFVHFVMSHGADTKAPLASDNESTSPDVFVLNLLRLLFMDKAMMSKISKLMGKWVLKKHYNECPLSKRKMNLLVLKLLLYCSGSSDAMLIQISTFWWSDAILISTYVPVSVGRYRSVWNTYWGHKYHVVTIWLWYVVCTYTLHMHIITNHFETKNCLCRSTDENYSEPRTNNLNISKQTPLKDRLKTEEINKQESRKEHKTIEMDQQRLWDS